MQEVLGESAAVTVETLRWNVLKAGTNVWYANNVAGRSSVVTTIERVFVLSRHRGDAAGLHRRLVPDHQGPPGEPAARLVDVADQGGVRPQIVGRPGDLISGSKSMMP